MVETVEVDKEMSRPLLMTVRIIAAIEKGREKEELKVPAL